MTAPISLPVVRPSPGARWAAYGCTLALLVLSAVVILDRVEASAGVQLLFGASALGLAILCGIFLDTLLVRLLARGTHLALAPSMLSLRGPAGEIVLDLSAPLRQELWRSEGDHKERGGLVRALLIQGEKRLLLLGTLPRLEEQAELPVALAQAEPRSFLDFSREERRTDALLLPREGDIAHVLAALPASTLSPA